MEQQNLLFDAFVILAAAIVAVPIASRMGLGTVLGYLIAGVVIGPSGLSWISHPEDVLHISEFGVVMLLFVIGLELNIKRLFEMKKEIFGIGGVQILGTALLIGTGLWSCGRAPSESLVAGLAFAMSSTAICLQVMGEKNLFGTPAGKSAFSVLLSQDLAVIPILALLPLLSKGHVTENATPLWYQSLLAIGVIASIIIGGRTLTRPLFRIIATTRSREVFSGFSLFIVIGIALLVNAVGLSMALGAFLAGILLADSEYRHELESNIEPFKGLLLGLFFMSVGMTVDWNVVLRDPLTILALVTFLLGAKFVVLWSLGKAARIGGSQSLLFGALLSQGGEFAFVLFNVASQKGVFGSDRAALYSAVVAISMFATPFLLLAYEKFLHRFGKDFHRPDDDTIAEENNEVIIAGFGRFGQIVGRFLHANRFSTTIIDHSPELIASTRRWGYKTYYGDASRLDLLISAGIEKAKILVLAIDDREQTLKIAELVKHNFPHIIIMSRAWDMIHVYDLLDRKVPIIERETFNAAVTIGEEALKVLGCGAYQARRAAQRFRKHDLETIQKLYAVRKDEKTMISINRVAQEELEKLLESDEFDAKTHPPSWG